MNGLNLQIVMMIINSPKLHIWPFVVCQWPFAGIPPCVNCLRVRGYFRTKPLIILREKSL